MKTCGKSEVESWINGKIPEIIRDLDRICRVPSVAEVSEDKEPPYGKACADAIRLILRMGQEYGFSTENYDDTVGCVHYGGTGNTSVGIWSHLDVVDPGPVSDWKHTAPFEPVVCDGYFIARGCQDNKSSGIMALYLLRYLKEHGIRPFFTTDCYFGSCEEQGMFDIDYYLSKGYPLPDLSLVPDSGFPACCGERGSFDGTLTFTEPVSAVVKAVKAGNLGYMPPDFAEIELDYSEAAKLPDRLPGSIRTEKREGPGGSTIRIVCTGVSGHASNPDEGVNALMILSDFILKYGLAGEKERKMFRFVSGIIHDRHGRPLDIFTEDEISGQTVCTATMAKLSGGHLKITFFSKFPVTADQFPFRERASAAAEKQGCTLEVTRFNKPAFMNPDHPVVRIFTDTYHQVTGNEGKPFVMSGGTYAHKLPHAFACGTGMPVPPAPDGLFLPGHGDYHEPDESISLERIRKALLIYILSFLRMDEEKVSLI